VNDLRLLKPPPVWSRRKGASITKERGCRNGVDIASFRGLRCMSSPSSTPSLVQRAAPSVRVVRWESGDEWGVAIDLPSGQHVTYSVGSRIVAEGEVRRIRAGAAPGLGPWAGHNLGSWSTFESDNVPTLRR
jgi:hypothetical protein